VKVIIEGTVYEGRTIDTLAIKHALQFDRECREHGYPLTWADVERIRAEMAGLETDDERARHPDALVLTAVTVWASRLAAGESVTFDEVISVPLGSMRFVVDEPDPSKDSTGAAAPDPRRARPGSGRAAAPRAKAARKGSPKPT
jgi:hypothetical protein